MDDTILADDKNSENAWKTVCDRYAPIIGKVTGAELRNIIRAVTVPFWADPEKHRQGRLDLFQTRRQLVAQAVTGAGLGNVQLSYEIADLYSREKDSLIAPTEGALETLNLLNHYSIPLVLITNGGAEMQRAKIRRFDLARYFKTILIEGEFGSGKPDARIFRAALDYLGLAAIECWMVGDNLSHDVGGAMQLGIKGVWVNRRGNEVPAGSTVRPDRTIHHLGELMKQIKLV
jgi:putative hydrolase of the HAD superfamily